MGSTLVLTQAKVELFPLITIFSTKEVQICFNTGGQLRLKFGAAKECHHLLSDGVQKELISILDQKQPHVSNIMAGKIGNFSSEKLTSFLKALNATVQIKVSIPKTKIAAA